MHGQYMGMPKTLDTRCSDHKEKRTTYGKVINNIVFT